MEETTKEKESPKLKLLSTKLLDSKPQNISEEKDKDYIKIMPYFYVNYLNFKKDKDTPNEIIKKEEINFYTNQICPKCKEENEFINIYDLIHHRIRKR